MDRIEVKKALIQECNAELDRRIKGTRKAMDDAQAEANEHKGAMESRYDTFKEEAQALRDGFARQLKDYLDAQGVLAQIPIRLCNIVEPGAIVVLDEIAYFLSMGGLTSKIVIEGMGYLAVNPASPIGKALLGKKRGDVVQFRDRKLAIRDIF